MHLSHRSWAQGSSDLLCPFTELATECPQVVCLFCHQKEQEGKGTCLSMVIGRTQISNEFILTKKKTLKVTKYTIAGDGLKKKKSWHIQRADCLALH